MSVPRLRFNGFSESWASKKLDEITSYVDYRGKTPEKSDTGVFLVTAKNIRQGFIDYETSQEYIPIETYEEVMRRGKPLIGDVLITTEAPLGYVASVDREGIALAQRVIKLRGLEGIIQNGFLKFHLVSDNFQKELFEKATGGTVKGIKGSVLHKMKLHFPVIPEQIKIANFLTAVDEKITQLTQKCDLLAQYKKGVMQQIFSQELRFKDDDGRDFPEWKTLKLSKLAKIYDGTHMTPEYTETGIPFYSVEHVTSNNFKHTKYVSENIFEKENNRVILEKGDILMTRIGDIGTPKFIDWDVRASFYVSLALIKQTKSINSLYLSHFISSSFFKNELHQRTIHVAFPKKINLGEIGECLVNFPEPEEQTKIANFLTAIDDKINNAQTQLAAVKQYKQGLLQQMFV